MSEVPNNQPAAAARFLIIPREVMELPAAISWPARLVLSEIINLYKPNASVWVGDEYFVDRLKGLSKRTVQVALTDLVSAGLVLRDTNQNRNPKRYLTPTLSATIPALPNADSALGRADLPQIMREPSAESALDLAQNLREASADSALLNKKLNKKGNTNQIKTGARENIFSTPSLEASLPASLVTAPAPVALPPAPGVPAFEVFWQAFGKKQDKHKCQQRWRTLKPAEQVAALAAVPAYVAATPEKHYRKNPLTWLNGKCWLDEDTPEPAPLLRSPAQPPPPPARASATRSKAQSWS